MGRTDLSFNLGTCLSTLKTVLPPAAPQGVTPSSRWLPIAQSPGRGLLMEKAGFTKTVGMGRSSVPRNPATSARALSRGSEGHSLWE